MSLLEVRDLVVGFGDLEAVRGVSFDLDKGMRLGLVGESGAGKSLTAMAILGLLPETAHAEGSVRFNGAEILNMRERDLAPLRGAQIGTVFQDPMTALNPVMRVGDQVAEMLLLHDAISKRKAREAAVSMLSRVGLPDAAAKARAYPHELSGGQRQRVMIAAAMACAPALLVADEPTTALDVTVQAEILGLMESLVSEEGSSLLMITHDLPVIASQCEEVLVMYGGRIVEHGLARDVFYRPRHPYTAGLIRAQPGPRPGQVDSSRRLPVIEGVVPSLGEFPSGCGFRDRCSRATAECKADPPLMEAPWQYRCWNPLVASDE
jgi:peptide/nickel transport system ATP-binding protein